MKTYSLFIGGKFYQTKKKLKVISPYNGGVVGAYYEAGKSEVERAIAASVKAFEEMKSLSSHDRAEILMRIKEGIEKEKETFIKILAQEAGKPVQEGEREVTRAIFNFQTAAEEAKRLHGETLPLDLFPNTKHSFGMVRRFPIGPILAITPFNFPLNLAVHKIAPAIACGNTVVLKPPHKTPMSTLHLAQIIAKSGLPKGAFNIVIPDPSLHDMLVTDERFKAISFTGSAKVGWEIKAKSGKKKVLLEMGGNAGVIVDKGADIVHAAKRVAFGAFSFSGQTCISVQRVYLHKSDEKKFTKALLGEIKKIKSGNPLNAKTTLAPMILPEAIDRTEAWLKESVQQGAKVLCGGKRKDPFFEPTVLTNVKKNSLVCKNEVFAPLVMLFTYTHFSKAIDQVNDSAYGLQAGVFTPNAEHMWEAYDKLEVGGVIINDIPTWRVDTMPYGGVKDSGFGREGIRYVIEETTEPKLLAINRL